MVPGALAVELQVHSLAEDSLAGDILVAGEGTPPVEDASNQVGNLAGIQAESHSASLEEVELQVAAEGLVVDLDNHLVGSLGSSPLYYPAQENILEMEGSSGNRAFVCATF